MAWLVWTFLKYPLRHLAFTSSSSPIVKVSYLPFTKGRYTWYILYLIELGNIIRGVKKLSSSFGCRKSNLKLSRKHSKPVMYFLEVRSFTHLSFRTKYYFLDKSSHPNIIISERTIILFFRIANFEFSKNPHGIHSNQFFWILPAFLLLSTNSQYGSTSISLYDESVNFWGLSLKSYFFELKRKYSIYFLISTWILPLETIIFQNPAFMGVWT